VILQERFGACMALNTLTYAYKSLIHTIFRMNICIRQKTQRILL